MDPSTHPDAIRRPSPPDIDGSRPEAAVRPSRRLVLGASGAGIWTLFLPGAASAASFDGTTLTQTQPGLLTVAVAGASDGIHDVVLTVTLTDEGQPFTDPVRIDVGVRDDQGIAAASTIEGSSSSDASKLSTTGTVTFALGFPSFADYQLTVTATPAAVSHPSGITTVYTHSTVPDAPTSVTGTAADTQVSLSWTAPGDGGATITGYETRRSTDDGASWTDWAATGSSAVGTTITGLENGTGYVFQVRAVNGNGAGASSTASATLTPIGTPGAPTSVTGTAGDGEVVLAWSAPADDGGTPITDHQTRHSTDGGANWTTWSATGSATVGTTITSLTNGTEYVFQVRTVNIVGESDPSSTSSAVTPRTTPSAPTITAITAGNGELTVAFTAGSDGGAAITNHAYELDGSGTWTVLSPEDATSPITITGLTNSTTYTVRIRAINTAGQGAPSNSLDGTPATLEPSTALATVATYLRSRMSDLRNTPFFSYSLDGDATRILDGGNDMFDNGNFTAPALRSGTTYIESTSLPSPLSYSQTTVGTTDTDFQYVSLGYGTNPDYRPLTMLGVRTTAGQPTGFQKAGNIGADGGGFLSNGWLHQGSTIAGFTVYAYYRQTWGQSSDPAICDVYLIFGHSTWGSSFGTVTATRSTNKGIQGAQLRASGASVANLMAATLLLSTGTPNSVSTSQMTGVISRMMGHVRDALGL